MEGKFEHSAFIDIWWKGRGGVWQWLTCNGWGLTLVAKKGLHL